MTLAIIAVNVFTDIIAYVTEGLGTRLYPGCTRYDLQVARDLPNHTCCVHVYSNKIFTVQNKATAAGVIASCREIHLMPVIDRAGGTGWAGWAIALPDLAVDAIYNY